MHRNPSLKALIAAVAVLALNLAVALPAQAQDTTDDAVPAESVIPTGVKELPGTSITLANANNLVTINRPEDRDRMFFLYNVGTGKFLNVGG